jgi:hypothetical protein
MLALCALLVGATLSLLQTRAGGELARRIALPRINAALAGSLALDELRFRGDRLALGGITLRDPRGGLVARVARVEVAFRPLALLRRRLLIRAVEITAPSCTWRRTRGAPTWPGRWRRATRRRSGRRQLARRTARKPTPRCRSDLKSLTVSDGVLDFRRWCRASATGALSRWIITGRARATSQPAQRPGGDRPGRLDFRAATDGVGRHAVRWLPARA